MPALITGTVAPEFTLLSTKGKKFSLEEALKRGPAVVAFFKISCPVCQMTFPFIERLHKAYPQATIVGVSQDEKEDTEMFVREYGLSFPVLLDDPAKYVASNAYGLTNVPSLFYVSPNSEIELAMVGWSRADIEDVSRRLAKFLGVPEAQLFKPGEDVPDFKAG
jgi:peroxiredoxin